MHPVLHSLGMYYIVHSSLCTFCKFCALAQNHSPRTPATQQTAVDVVLVLLCSALKYWEHRCGASQAPSLWHLKTFLCILPVERDCRPQVAGGAMMVQPAGEVWLSITGCDHCAAQSPMYHYILAFCISVLCASDSSPHMDILQWGILFRIPLPSFGAFIWFRWPELTIME